MADLFLTHRPPSVKEVDGIWLAVAAVYANDQLKKRCTRIPVGQTGDDASASFVCFLLFPPFRWDFWEKIDSNWNELNRLKSRKSIQFGRSKRKLALMNVSDPIKRRSLTTDCRALPPPWKKHKFMKNSGTFLPVSISKEVRARAAH